jgi:hypothetical protein
MPDVEKVPTDTLVALLLSGLAAAALVWLLLSWYEIL